MVSPRTKLPDSDLEAIEAMKRAGVPHAEIARRSGWSLGTVNRALKRLGLTRPPGETRRAVVAMAKDGLSGAEIARQLGIHPSNAREHMRRGAPKHDSYGIRCDHCPARARRTRASLPPGWRRVALDGACGATVTECPECSVAWDLEQWRRADEAPRRPVQAESPFAGVNGEPVEPGCHPNPISGSGRPDVTPPGEAALHARPTPARGSVESVGVVINRPSPSGASPEGPDRGPCPPGRVPCDEATTPADVAGSTPAPRARRRKAA